VNAPLLAAERGTAVRLVADPESPDHRNLITIRGTLADGSQVSVSGTLVGINQRERLVEVNGFDVDLEPTEHLAFFRYEDRPGMVGTVGSILGEAGVNIAGMQVARDAKGGQALVALSVDSAIPAETLAEIESSRSPCFIGDSGQVTSSVVTQHTSRKPSRLLPASVWSAVASDGSHSGESPRHQPGCRPPGRHDCVVKSITCGQGRIKRPPWPARAPTRGRRTPAWAGA
jgi:hypothetical protein